MPMLLFAAYAVALALAVAASIVVLGTLPASGVSVLPLFGGVATGLESPLTADPDETTDSHAREAR